MELKEPVLKILSKQYEPLTMITLNFKRYDLSFKTDQKGRPILLFMGRMTDNGQVRGERYVRRLKEDKEGKLIKDHWDHKGKAT